MALLGEIIGCFVAGAAAGEAVALSVGRLRLPVVILMTAAFLTLPLLAAMAAVPAMTFSMGALNAAMHKAGAVPVSVTYATGSLVKFGQGLTRWLCRAETGVAWLQQTVPWLGLLAGATLAALSLKDVGALTNQALPVLALVLALVAYMAVPRHSGAR